ncbi:hypothetical protein [Sorangium sp. So ce385]|uniref:hypothetical protein n=1 Tax=Sorangium sp. So ce385 TaxID=3133308 RepID=UPI003F5BB2A9
MTVDRARLSEEFSYYLSDEKLRGAAARIKALGEPEDVVVESVTERGGMDHAVITFVFEGVTARGVLYRTPDGKIQQFLLGRGEPMRPPRKPEHLDNS